MFSSKLLFQVIALLTSQSNVVWLAFILCLRNGCLLCRFIYFFILGTNLFRPKCTMSEAKSRRKKFNCTRGWTQLSERLQILWKPQFQPSTSRASWCFGSFTRTRSEEWSSESQVLANDEKDPSFLWHVEGTVHSHRPSLDDAASLESLQFRYVSFFFLTNSSFSKCCCRAGDHLDLCYVVFS